MKKLLFILSALLLCSMPIKHADANDYTTLLDLPSGVSIVTLSATEKVEIEQDLLTANLYYQVDHHDARELQQEINKVMSKAVDEAKKVRSVKVSTQQYYVHQYSPPQKAPRYDKREQIWRGRQGLTLKGQDAEDLLELVGKLQDMGLSSSGLNYSLSPEKLEEARDSLLEAALEKLQSKAQRTARALGKSKAELKEINVDMGSPSIYRPMMARGMQAESMSMAKSSAPVAEAGESQVSLTVNAKALLK